MMFRLRDLWLVGIHGLRACALVLALLAGACDNAEEQKLVKSPGSADPILRHLPLEKERVRPEPTPGLDLAHVPGKQTVVLRASSGAEKVAGRPSPLLVLRVPAEYFTKVDMKPMERWHLPLAIKYPDMRPLIIRLDSCRGFCNGLTRMLLGNTPYSVPKSRHTALMLLIERQTALSEPSIVIEEREPPQDYTEAYVSVRQKGALAGNRSKHYFKRNIDGRIVEYVLCHPDVPSPSCKFFIALPSQKNLDIWYVLSMDHWPQRQKVKRRILQFVRELYAGEISSVNQH